MTMSVLHNPLFSYLFFCCNSFSIITGLKASGDNFFFFYNWCHDNITLFNQKCILVNNHTILGDNPELWISRENHRSPVMNTDMYVLEKMFLWILIILGFGEKN